VGLTQYQKARLEDLGQTHVKLLFILTEDHLKLKYKIKTSQTHLRHAHYFPCKARRVFLAKAIARQRVKSRAGFRKEPIGRTDLVVHVGAGVDTLLGEFGKGDLETLLNRLQNSLIFGAADEGDAETLGSETTGTTDTVKVRVSLVRHVVVDGDVDALNINTTTEDVSGHTDTGLEVLELLVALDTALLLASRP